MVFFLNVSRLNKKQIIIQCTQIRSFYRLVKDNPKKDEAIAKIHPATLVVTRLRSDDLNHFILHDQVILLLKS